MKTGEIAIVGAGPSGLFLALEIRKRLGEVSIDLLDGRKEPFGLVRFGVAPDHMHTRRVMKVMGAALADPKVRFLGGVRVDGRGLKELRDTYSAVALCIGAEKAKGLGLANGGKEQNVWTGMEFARWVNGDGVVDPPQLVRARRAVVIGNGNVALDVARLLLRRREAFAGSDIDPGAREALLGSGIEEVVVMGRRGPVQASFGEMELEEVVEQEVWRVRVEAEDLELSEEDRKGLRDSGEERAGRVVELLESVRERRAQEGRKGLRFLFWRRPVGYGLDEGGRVGWVEVEGRSGRRERLEAGFVVEAIGQETERLEGVRYAGWV